MANIWLIFLVLAVITVGVVVALDNFKVIDISSLFAKSSTSTSISTSTSTTPNTSSSTAPPSVVVPNWSALTGVDFSGNDLSLTGNKTQDECENLCSSTSGCAAAVYSPLAKNCWLKSKLGEASNKTDRTLIVPPLISANAVSSWRKLLNQDIPANDLACFTDGSSPDKCAALCGILDGCKAYNQSSSGCCLKKTDSGSAVATGVNLWVK